MPNGRTEAAAAATGQPAPARRERTKLSGGVYVGIAAALIILVVVLDFIVQNLDEAHIHLFSAEFRLPIGILVLLGAIGGGVIVFLICLYQFLRMRHAVRHGSRPKGTARSQNDPSPS